MGRPCIICTNNLSSLIRQRVKEAKAPSDILREIKKKYELDIGYHQYRYHVKHHDIQSGTNILVKRAADEKMAAATDLFAKSRKMVEDTQSHLANILSMWGEISLEDFESMRPSERIKAINSTVKVMADLKKIEISQQRLDMDRDPHLDDLNRLISHARVNRKKADVIQN